MINGSLLPLFFHEDAPSATGGTFFGRRYFPLRYFSNYMPPARVGVPSGTSLTDDVEISLQANTGVEFSLGINKRLDLELGIHIQPELELTVNRKLEYTVER
jgi:hypothetical protein